MSNELSNVERALSLARSTLHTIDTRNSVETKEIKRAIAHCDDALLLVAGVHAEVGRVESLQRRVAQWANGVFPARRQKDVILKLFEEVGEVLKDPGDPGELADVLILVLDLFTIAGIDPAKALHDKMAVNEAREWSVNEVGIMRHVEAP